MKVLITGAGGLVGGHLAEYFEREHEAVALSRTQLDISNSFEVDRSVTLSRPELILNCAVIGVDECETDPGKAQAVNVTGPRNLAKAASSIGAEIVHFSTNYVFSGILTSGYYSNDDDADPVNVYGRTKLEGERAVIQACERSYIVRTSWVFGMGKDNFYGGVYWRLKAGETVEASDDIFASATYVRDLVARVAEVLRHRSYGTYQIVNSGLCSKYEFATEAGRSVGLDEKAIENQLMPVSGADRDGKARRPRYTPMRCTLSEEIGLGPMRDWKVALQEYIQANQEYPGSIP